MIDPPDHDQSRKKGEGANLEESSIGDTWRPMEFDLNTPCDRQKCQINI